MLAADLEILGKALHWLQEDQQPLLVTVVGTWGSSPRPVGSMLAMCMDGLHAGSVSGGCVEADLFQRMQAGEWQDLQQPQILSYGVTQEEANRFGLPCGGQLDLLLEPLQGKAEWSIIHECMSSGQVVQRSLDVASGAVQLTYNPDGDTPAFEFAGHTVNKLFGPQWRMLLVGANHLAQYVAQFAQALDYQVLVCEPREEYRQQWDVPQTQLLTSMPDDAVRELGHYQRSIILTLTHDPKLDDMALMEALHTEAFYVGALGSKRSSDKRRQRLQTLDVSPVQLERLHAPVGLDIGSHTPAEIAVAIMAEITALRNRLY